MCVYFASNVKAQSLADSIKVPNVFTPNLDGINDMFKLRFRMNWRLAIILFPSMIVMAYLYLTLKNQGSIGMEEQQLVIPALTEPIFTYYN